ncbi:MAG: GNAT family N-acetyltransferase [Mycobacteriaceae bacterium]
MTSTDTAPERAIEIRRGTAADVPAIQAVNARAFGEEMGPEGRAEGARLTPGERHVLALQGSTVIGVTALMPLRMTVPGGAQVDAAGISNVSVAATHRRRGVLRQILGAQHRDLLAQGYPLAALTASEGTIYGRFGYGPATVRRRVEIDRRGVEVARSAPDPGGVALVGAETARGLLPALHERWATRTPGALRRDETWWDWQLADRPEDRPGSTSLCFLLHPDGYASYRAHGSRAEVVEVISTTDAAHAALWRVLLGLDFADVLAAPLSPDDPLPFLLTDTRAVRVVGVRDGMWVRPLDVAAALALRRWAVEIDVVLGITDPFLDRGGRFRLRGGPEGSECVRTDDAAAVNLDVATLGALYLGGHRVSTLARAGLLTGAAPAVLARLELALLTDRAPENGTDF